MTDAAGNVMETGRVSLPSWHTGDVGSIVMPRGSVCPVPVHPLVRSVQSEPH